MLWLSPARGGLGNPCSKAALWRSTQPESGQYPLEHRAIPGRAGHLETRWRAGHIQAFPFEYQPGVLPAAKRMRQVGLRRFPILLDQDHTPDLLRGQKIGRREIRREGNGPFIELTNLHLPSVAAPVGVEQERRRRIRG